MRIGIDISQIVYKTGVSNYLESLVTHLLTVDKSNQYILFASSLRQDFSPYSSKFTSLNSQVEIKTFKFPPTLLDVLWNRLHLLPIESLIGPVDLFITSDWTEPPVKKAKKATILYDLIVYKYPEETAGKIVSVQKRKLEWVKKETNIVFCISEATKKDAREIIGLEEEKLQVLYPGV